MKIRVVTRVVAAIVFVMGFTMLSSVIVSWLMGEPTANTIALLYSSLTTIVIGGSVMIMFKDKSELGFRDGFGIVTFSWLACSLFGAIPFILVKDKSIERSEKANFEAEYLFKKETVELINLQLQNAEENPKVTLESKLDLHLDQKRVQKYSKTANGTLNIIRFELDKDEFTTVLHSLKAQGNNNLNPDIKLKVDYYGGLSFVDSFFETMSGFSTTGSTILTEIEHQPKGLLWWRSLTQWLGGMGIVVLSLAILPILGIGGMQLYKAEAPGPTSDKLTPRIASSAKYLWMIYLGMSATVLLLLLIGGMSLYDAACHTFTTLATGGFSTKNASIGAFGSSYIEWVIIIFMFLGGVNFVLHLRAVSGKPLNYFKDDEFRFYTSVVLICITFLFLNLYFHDHYNRNILEILRHSCFNVLTIITTTGYGTEDFDLWPIFAKALIVFLMFSGACGGSTSGGMKVSRTMLLFRHAIDQIRRCLFPRSVPNVRLQDKRVSDDIIQPVLGFFYIYIALFALITLAICFIEPGLKEMSRDSAIDTSFTAAISSLCNIGPGLGQVGPTQNFAWMAPQTKILCSLAMLIGRLEVYTVIVLFLPSFWRK